METVTDKNSQQKLKMIVLDKRVLNWKRISINDFGAKYSQDFKERKKTFGSDL